MLGLVELRLLTMKVVLQRMLLVRRLILLRIEHNLARFYSNPWQLLSKHHGFDHSLASFRDTCFAEDKKYSGWEEISVASLGVPAEDATDHSV